MGEIDSKENNSSDENMSFDEALEKLEEKVNLLEDGELPLEDALENFKEGINLVQICSQKLKDAETVITQLTSGENGEVQEIQPELNLGGE